MSNDPSQRTLPNNRRTVDFIPYCCTSPITWDIDLTDWDTTPEIFGNTYYKTIEIIIYIGPQ